MNRNQFMKLSLCPIVEFVNQRRPMGGNEEILRITNQMLKFKLFEKEINAVYIYCCGLNSVFLGVLIARSYHSTL